jgi:hypothetical protein
MKLSFEIRTLAIPLILSIQHGGIMGSDQYYPA